MEFLEAGHGSGRVGHGSGRIGYSNISLLQFLIPLFIFVRVCSIQDVPFQTNFYRQVKFCSGHNSVGQIESGQFG